MKYVLMFVETEEYAKELEAMAPDERDRAYQRVMQWFDDHRDKIRSGNKLQAAESATTVRFGGGVPMTTDGPFIEGKEVISGFTRDRGRRSRRGAADGEDLAGLPDRRDPASAAAV